MKSAMWIKIEGTLTEEEKEHYKDALEDATAIGRIHAIKILSAGNERDMALFTANSVRQVMTQAVLNAEAIVDIIEDLEDLYQKIEELEERLRECEERLEENEK